MVTVAIIAAITVTVTVKINRTGTTTVLNMEACYVTLKVEPSSRGAEKGTIALEMRTIETQRLVCSSDPIDAIVDIGPDTSLLHLLPVAGNQFVVTQHDTDILQWTLLSIVYHTQMPVSIKLLAQHKKQHSAWTELLVIDEHRLLVVTRNETNYVAYLYRISDGTELSRITSTGMYNNSLMREYSKDWCHGNINSLIKFANVDDTLDIKQSVLSSYFKEVGLIVTLVSDRVTIWRKDGRKLTHALSCHAVRHKPILSFDAIVGDYCLLRYYNKRTISAITNIRTGDMVCVDQHTCLVVPTVHQLQVVYRPLLLDRFKGCKDLADLVISYLVDVHSVKAHIPV